MSNSPTVQKPTFSKVIKDGKVAVLYSPRYGAGWSTWNSENRDFLLFDSGLVDLAEKHASEADVEAYLTRKLGDAPYCGGWIDIRIEWISQGTAFEVTEYDDYESIREHDISEWSIA
jgi:hypothetical protein